MLMITLCSVAQDEQQTKSPPKSAGPVEVRCRLVVANPSKPLSVQPSGQHQQQARDEEQLSGQQQQQARDEVLKSIEQAWQVLAD